MKRELKGGSSVIYAKNGSVLVNLMKRELKVFLLLFLGLGDLRFESHEERIESAPTPQQLLGLLRGESHEERIERQPGQARKLVLMGRRNLMKRELKENYVLHDQAVVVPGIS